MSIISTYIVPHPPLIIPSIGGGQEGRIQDTVDAFEKIASEIGEAKPETVVVITPHSIMYQDYIHISPGAGAMGNFRRFGDNTTEISVSYDREFVSTLEEMAAEENMAAGTLGERDKNLDHGTMVPIYFIDKYLKDYKLVRISISGLSPSEHYRLGKMIKAAAERLGRRTVVIASGDLSHKLKDDGPYSFAEEGPLFDKQVTEAMDKGDFLAFMEFEDGFVEAAGECGLRGFIVMAGTLDGKAVKSKLLSYEGPFGVGYGIASFYPGGDDENRHMDKIYIEEVKDKIKEIRENEDSLVSLARLSLESYVKNRKYIDRPMGLPKDIIKNKAGIFVSLKKEGKLRGCIGTISPTEENIAEEIIKNAISAGTGDPRFDPVREEELEHLVYSVDVLGDPEPVSSMEDLDALRYGVIVSKGKKRGLLLPNLEGVTNPEQQIEIALKKAGIPSNSSYSLERFEVVRHK